MPKKLKNLTIKKIDFVTEGANPYAHIKMFKGKVKPEEIKKTAESFKDKVRNTTLDEVYRQIWGFTEALSSSLISILTDNELDDKIEAMNKSLEEFYGAATLSVEYWSKGESSNYSTSCETADEVAEIIKNLKNTEIVKSKYKLETAEIEEGDEVDMTLKDIDTSKLSEDEIKQLENIINKAGIKDCEKNCSGKKPAKNVAKKKEDEQEDIYKGLNPIVQQELEEFRKFRDEVEMKELTDIAKKYEVIGKKPEELVPTFKSLKAAGGTAFNDMISVLDASVEAIEKSGAFREVGASGHIADGSTAIAKAKALAAEIKKNAPELTDNQAMAKVWEANPNLMAEYDAEIGG